MGQICYAFITLNFSLTQSEWVQVLLKAARAGKDRLAVLVWCWQLTHILSHGALGSQTNPEAQFSDLGSLKWNIWVCGEGTLTLPWCQSDYQISTGLHKMSILVTVDLDGYRQLMVKIKLWSQTGRQVIQHGLCWLSKSVIRFLSFTSPVRYAENIT